MTKTEYRRRRAELIEVATALAPRNTTVTAAVCSATALINACDQRMRDSYGDPCVEIPEQHTERTGEKMGMTTFSPRPKGKKHTGNP